jgi:porin
LGFEALDALRESKGITLRVAIARSQPRRKRRGLLAASLGLAGLLAGPVTFAQEAISTRGGSRDSPASPVVGAINEGGITFPVALTTEVLGNLSGGTSRTVIWESLVNFGVAIDLEKLAGWKGGSLSARAIYPQGSGLTNEAVHDFDTLSNIDGYDSLRLYDVWLQQDFGGGELSLRAGQLLADAEFFNSDYATLFINSSFGAIPLVSQNLNPPIFPTAAPGVRVRAAPSDLFYAEVALFSGDAGGPDTSNKHNTRLSFRGADGVLVFAEIGFTSNPKPNESAAAEAHPLTGTYKLGGDYDSKAFADRGEGPPHDGNYSIYLVVDQELWHPQGKREGGLSCFARAGIAPADRNTVTRYGDAGFNYKGPRPGRDEDILGLAFSYTQLSQKLLDNLGRPLLSHHEAVLELTYQAACGNHLSIQPDLQFIFNPGATKPARTAIVAGVRFNVQF